MNNKTMELISVIVITYNSEKTIIDTLDSIKNQTYPNIEIIVSDDASKDNTVEVASRWFENNADVLGKVVPAEKNGGVPANLNKGIRNATGKLTKAIAGDDMLTPEAIRVFYEYYLENPDSIFVSDVKLFGIDEDKQKVLYEEMPDTEFYTWNNKKQYKALSIYNRIAAPAIGLISKDVFEKYGYYDETIRLMEDYPFNLKMSKNGICYRYIDKKLIKYRISESSITGSVSKNYHKCMQRFFFRTRLWALLRNGCFRDFVTQTIRYTLVTFGLNIVKIDGKHRIERI